jgi:hypothetical protein
MAPNEWIRRKEFDRVREETERAVAIAQGNVRQKVS